MNNRMWFATITACLAFPQIVETIYSPALPGIEKAFHVSPAVAAQTMSCYFIGFSIGVMVWGWLCDLWGRRPAMLVGLTIYAMAALAAMVVHSFSCLLMVRMISAFGAAVGSVVTQTMLRDRLTGAELARSFATIGSAIALSPVLGLFAGTASFNRFGYRGVFATVVLLATVLLAFAIPNLEETRPNEITMPSLMRVANRMICDAQIWVSAVLIALLNVSLFSYYALASFQIARIGAGSSALTLGGIAMAAGSLTGPRIASFLRLKGIENSSLIALGCCLHVLSGALIFLLQGSCWFLPAMALVALSFSIVIPIILGNALAMYSDCRGRAGALLGLIYYALIAGGLAVAGWVENLGVVLLLSSIPSLAAARWYGRMLDGHRLQMTQRHILTSE